jgi:hypothetical protein
MCACGKRPSCKRTGVTMNYHDACRTIGNLTLLGETRESLRSKAIKAEEKKATTRAIHTILRSC